MDITIKGVFSNGVSSAVRPPHSGGYNNREMFCFATQYCDGGACGNVRGNFVDACISALRPNCVFSSGRMLSLDTEVLSTVRSYRLQRISRPNELGYIRGFLVPQSRKSGFKIIYDIDDLLIYDHIPVFNFHRKDFRNSESVIAESMRVSDIIIVSCERLKARYAERFGLPEEKFRVIPSTYPRFAADHYDDDAVVARIKKRAGRKPRIAFAASASHFDLMNLNGGVDDFSGVCDWIIANRHRYQFVFYGGLNRILGKYAGDFEVRMEKSFLTYLAEFRKHNVDLYIQPLADCEFNHCKSAIKHHEAWACGVPIFTQDTDNYLRSAPELCFHDAEQLDHMVNLLFSNNDLELNMIRRCRQRMDDGRFWTEDRVDEWLRVMI